MIALRHLVIKYSDSITLMLQKSSLKRTDASKEFLEAALTKEFRLMPKKS